MYPILLHTPYFDITSFGLMVAVGAFAGLLLLRRELTRSRLDATRGVDAAIAGLLGGLLGAKLLYVAEHWSEGIQATLFSRGGMSWFGGFAGGVSVGLFFARRNGLPVWRLFAAATPALALGHALGRIGCFLVGDDYGRPTDLPWGVAFPEGLPPTFARVHPTQLYEATILFLLSAVLVKWRRSGTPDTELIGRYLAIAGMARFAIEFLRVDVRVFYGLSVAHIASAVVTIIGVVMLVAAWSRATTSARSEA